MLTVKEVAERLRCSAKTIYRRVEASELPFARRNGGRALIFSEQGLTKWLARQRG
jgi:excisionase family DNA binding protein